MKPFWDTAACSNNPSFPNRRKVLTEGLERDVVGRNLELEVSLGVVGSTVLGRRTNQSCFKPPGNNAGEWLVARLLVLHDESNIPYAKARTTNASITS